MAICVGPEVVLTIAEVEIERLACLSESLRRLAIRCSRPLSPRGPEITGFFEVIRVL